MEISIVYWVVLAVGAYWLYTYTSELHAKMDILLESQNIDWEGYFTEEIQEHIARNNFAKAALLLRSKTGLSFRHCQKIVEKSNIAST